MSEEIKKVHFNRSPEGYSVEDVDRYVEQINGEYLKLEMHCRNSDRKLLLALRKLDALTLEFQNLFSESKNSLADVTEASDGDVAQSVPSETAEKELDRVREELEAKLREAEDIKKQSEAKAAELLRAASAKAAALIREAEGSKADADAVLESAKKKHDEVISTAQAQADAIISGTTKKARSAAEHILTEAALNARKIIREAEAKADSACRDVLSIYKAAEKMYDEVSSFRGALFSLYSSHIESIETIAGSAHVLVDSVDGIVRDLEGKEPAPAPKPAEEKPEFVGIAGEKNEATGSDVSEKANGSTEVPDEPGDDIADYDEPEVEISPADEPKDEIPAADKPEPTEEQPAADNNGIEEEEEEEEEDFLGEAPAAEIIGEYYDSFDEIPYDDEEDFDDLKATDEHSETEDADEAGKAYESTEADEFDESAQSDEPDEPDAPTEAHEPDESNESSEADEEENNVSESDDFELPDDVSGGTSMLEIIKKIAEQSPPKPAPSTDSSDEYDFADIEKIFSGELSVSDAEFNRAFSSSGTSRDIEEIRSQPIVAPAVPEKPKKHSKF